MPASVTKTSPCLKTVMTLQWIFFSETINYDTPTCIFLCVSDNMSSVFPVDKIKRLRDRSSSKANSLGREKISGTLIVSLSFFLLPFWKSRLALKVGIVKILPTMFIEYCSSFAHNSGSFFSYRGQLGKLYRHLLVEVSHMYSKTSLYFVKQGHDLAPCYAKAESDIMNKSISQIVFDYIKANRVTAGFFTI